MATQPLLAARKPSFWRAFLPFWITLLWGSMLLSRDYHIRHAALTRLAVQVTVEGKQPEEEISVEVNGKRQDLYLPVPIGFAKIRVYAQDCESEVRDRFVWYGVTDLGSMDLARSRGSIAASVVPSPDSYELKGKRGNWTNATGFFAEVPVGRYELVGRFGSLIEQAKVEVTRNQTNRVEVAAKIGSLELSAGPVEGEFDLVFNESNEHRVGKFPSKYARLPVGGYRLIAKRPGYERELKLDVRRNETNRFLVKFVFGSAEITTTPAGATILWAQTEKGTTPLTLTNLVPGTYRMEARLEGYDSRNRLVTVEEDAPAKVALALVNTRYREAMESAHQSLDRNQNGRAAKYLEAALVAQPGDAEATKLLPRARARGSQELAELYAQRGNFDAALTELSAALIDLPNDAAITALQEKYRAARVETDQKSLEARYGALMAKAKFEAGRQYFDTALALLGDAKKIAPDKAEIAEWESAFRKDQVKWKAEMAEKERQDQFTAAWEEALNGENDRVTFGQQNWKTSKSVAEVKAALERIGSADAASRVSEFTSGSEDVFTAKLGKLVPFVGIGNYVRIGVMKYEEGNTQIVLKVFGYVFGKESATSPDHNVERLNKRAEKLRADLIKQLGTDVK